MAAQRTPGIHPRPTLWRRLDAASRQCFPVACTALLLLALASPLCLPAQAQLQPAAALACVFFWSLFRPASMPPAAAFALGLLSDLLGLAPLGLSALILLLAHGLALRWSGEPAGRGFLAVWLAFAALSAAAAALGWAVTGLLALRVMPADAALLQFGLAAGLYPALAALLMRAHRGLANPDRA